MTSERLDDTFEFKGKTYRRLPDAPMYCYRRFEVVKEQNPMIERLDENWKVSAYQMAYAGLWHIPMNNETLSKARRLLLEQIGGQHSNGQREALKWASQFVHQASEDEIIKAIDAAEWDAPDALTPKPQAGEVEPVAWGCRRCNSPRSVDPCPKCGTPLTKPADGWEWPSLPDIDHIRKLAREVGYAIGVHGSQERDCDLIAVPWVADAVEPLALAKHIADGLGGEVVDYETQDKPCGRWACNIHTPDWTKLIDLSVMPPQSTITALQDKLARVEKERDEARAEVTEHEQSFDLRWKADMRAIERWRKLNPGNDLVLPDHVDLCVWQFARIAALEEAITWALGENGDFPAREEGQGAYWWRTELRRRARALKEGGENG